ncbi:hypothetical protein NIES25_48360 [Nostoc linckia NIES-25]|nr:hypothetical protein NIES25_48360 [Nostoc linckia NIES-25]
MTIYCNGASKAIITVIGDGNKKVFESPNPPVDVQWHESTTTNRTYQATSSWGETFESEIIDVTLTSSNPIYFAVGLFEDNLPTTCPTIDTPNTNRFGSGDVIHIDKKSLSWNGDSNYNDNSGSCSYQIRLMGYLSITDANGKAMYGYYRNKPDWYVTCDDDCPEGSYKCTHNKYPGYCCVPCKEVANRINNIAKKVGR